MASTDSNALRRSGSGLRQIFGVGSSAGVGGIWTGEALEAEKTSTQASTAAEATQTAQSKIIGQCKDHFPVVAQAETVSQISSNTRCYEPFLPAPWSWRLKGAESSS